MAGQRLRILIIGAHPDDCESKAGGFAALSRRHGHDVCLMSMTNGCTGHYEMGGGALARRRRDEAAAAASVIGAASLVLDIPNNGFDPHLFLRYRLIEVIRNYRADIVVTHRPNDYHPDHRYTGVLVQDTSTALANPNVCPLTDRIPPPVFLYMNDGFRKPAPFDAHLVFDIDDVIGTKIEMQHCHASQMYEWMPWEGGVLDEVPAAEEARGKWLFDRRTPRDRDAANRFRDRLKARYGEERGAGIVFAEAFEFSEYGSGRLRKACSENPLEIADFPF